MKRFSRPSRAVFAAVLAAAALLAPFFAKRGADRPEPAGSEGSPSLLLRPGAVYRPKAEPLRRAVRPARSVPADGGRPEPGGADDGGGEAPEEGPSGEPPEDPPPPELRDDDPALVSLEPERVFSETVWNSLSAPPGELAAEASRLLASDEPEERARGGVLLFFGQLLEGELLESVASDPDPLVPLTVLDWVRDFGTEDQAAAFRHAFAGRGTPAEELLALAENSGGLAGGGRSALDLFLAGFAEDDVPVDALARIVASPDASYDVREQALFKLLEPESRPAGEAALRAFADGLPESDGDLLPFAAGKLAELAGISNPDGDDEKIWDSEAPVVFFLAQTEGGLQARDLANYLEYALRRDDPDYPPVVEIGTWEFANDFLLRAQDGAVRFHPAELDAFDRIAASLDRLVEYDPAFQPFETVEDDGDEDEEYGGDEEEEDETGD